MIYEKFQNSNNSQNQSLDSAYSGESLNIISNNSSVDLGVNTIAENAGSVGNNAQVSDNLHQHIELEDAKFDFNIWDLLGISNLGKDKHNCVLDCGIKSLHSLEKCSKGPSTIYEVFDGKNKQKCKLKSYKDALKCAKKCYNLDTSVEYVTPNNLLSNNINNIMTTSTIPTTPIVTTQSLKNTITEQVTEQVSELKYNAPDINGVYASVNNLSPYEAKYWPGENKYGWDTNSIDEYNNSLSDKVIEVRSRQYPEFNIAKPFLEFDSHNEENKSKQFYPYTTEEPNLQFGDTGMDMMLHEVEGFQNREGFQNASRNEVIVKDKVFEVGQLVLDRKCPYEKCGCKLHYNKEEHVFHCICNHSRFNMRGDCISGPACPSNLRF
jgi:hypothetical protein